MSQIFLNKTQPFFPPLLIKHFHSYKFLLNSRFQEKVDFYIFLLARSLLLYRDRVYFVFSQPFPLMLLLSSFLKSVFIGYGTQSRCFFSQHYNNVPLSPTVSNEELTIILIIAFLYIRYLSPPLLVTAYNILFLSFVFFSSLIMKTYVCFSLYLSVLCFAELL